MLGAEAGPRQAARVAVSPGRRPAVALAGQIAWLLLGAAILAGAVLFARDGILHLWAEVAPVYRDRSLNSRADFSWFYYAMQVAWQHRDPGRLLYDVAAEDRWMAAHHFAYDHLDVYGYPPQFALFWAPLAALPYAVARTLWTRINLLALGIGLGAAAWHASPRPTAARLLLLGGAGLWIAALQSNFYWGQPNALVLAAVALGLLGICRERARPWPAALGGVALGIGAALKLMPIAILLFLPARWLLSRGRDGGTGRAAAAGLGAAVGWATLAVSSLACGLLLGFGTLSGFVRDAVPAAMRSAWGHGPAPWNQALRGVLMLYEHNNLALGHQADLFAAAVCLAAVAVVAARPRMDVRLEGALAGLLVLLPWPSLEDHHFTLALAPGILLAGYLLDRAASWRRAWLWPLCALFAVAAVALVGPTNLQWPPAFLRRAPGVAVPPGRYREVFLLGAASYGPVHWDLRLGYRGAPAGSVAAVWPDWWSPGSRPPALLGEAEAGGAVHNARVGLFAFGYPVRAGVDLVRLGFPATLPQQNGGPEALHVVAVTLQTASGAFVSAPLPYNAHGIAPSPDFAAPNALSFDGAGNAFWSPAWPGVLRAAVGAETVPFSLPNPAAARNTLSAPAGAPPARGRPGVFRTVVQKAPDFMAISLLFLVAGVAGLGDGGEPPRAAGRPNP